MSVELALVRVPRLLADLLREAFSADDVRFDLLDDESEVQVMEIAGRPRHDVVIACADDPWRSELAALMMARSDLVILGVHPDARTAWIYELRSYPRPLGSLDIRQVRCVVLDALGMSA